MHEYYITGGTKVRRYMDEIDQEIRPSTYLLTYLLTYLFFTKVTVTLAHKMEGINNKVPSRYVISSANHIRIEYHIIIITNEK